MSKRSLATPNGASAKWTTIALCVLGVAMLVLYRIGVNASGVADIVWFLKLVAVQSLIYLVITWLSLGGRDSRSVLVLGLTFAALFRLSIVFSPPYLSDDIYRYIWDGRVQGASINPYRYIPADEYLQGLRDKEIYPKINRRDYAHTMYPPAAELMFFLTTRISESVTWMKLTIVGFELITVWILIELLASFGMARQRILIYAWHPLAVWEFAGSGHMDPLAFAFIALALLSGRRQWETATGFALGFATLAKLFPLVLFPVLYKRWGWKMPAALVVTIVAGYLPYLGVGPWGVLGFIPGYAQERGIVSGEQFFLLSLVDRLLGVRLPTGIFVLFAGGALLAIGVRYVFKGEQGERDYLKRGLVLGTALMVLFSPHFSWYFAWLILFLCFVPSVPVFYVTISSFLLYLTWLGDAPDRVLKIKAIIYLPALVLGTLVMWWWRRRRESGPRAADAGSFID
jgi:alpha-1,6-mannosyltransferase